VSAHDPELWRFTIRASSKAVRFACSLCTIRVSGSLLCRTWSYSTEATEPIAARVPALRLCTPMGALERRHEYEQYDYAAA